MKGAWVYLRTYVRLGVNNILAFIISSLLASGLRRRSDVFLPFLIHRFYTLRYSRGVMPVVFLKM